MSTYQPPRWGAIVAASLCTCGAAAILIADAGSLSGLGIDHGLAVIALFITIAAGHMAWREMATGHPLRAIGLALVFAAAVVFTIASTAGRAIEKQTSAAADDVARNKARTDKAAELGRVRQRLDQAEAQAEREMTGQRCGQRCEDWKQRAREVRSHLRILEVELANLGAERTVNAKIAGIAQLVTLIAGGDEKALAVKLAIAWPFVLPLLLELGSIVFWSIGLPKGRHAVSEMSAQTSFPTADPPPAAIFVPDADISPAAERERMVVDFVRAHVARHGRMPRHNEVMKATGLPRATTSRHLKRARAIA